jgi:hypothetical protein
MPKLQHGQFGGVVGIAIKLNLDCFLIAVGNKEPSTYMS